MIVLLLDFQILYFFLNTDKTSSKENKIPR